MDPDEFQNIEIGTKWDINSALSLTAAVFEIETTDLEPLSTTYEEKQFTISSFEVQLQGQLTDKWYISAGYGRLEGKDADGDTPRELPEHMISLWNQYQVNDQLALGLGAIYQEESLISAGSTNTLQASHFDAMAAYQVNEAIRIQLNIENSLTPTTTQVHTAPTK